MEQKETVDSAKYYCKLCDYGTSRKSSYDKHLTTKKHIEFISTNNLEKKGCDKEKKYLCQNCDKEFVNRSGLWKHNKICNNKTNLKEETSDKELIMMLIKENSILRKEQSDIKELILKISKNNEFL